MATEQEEINRLRLELANMEDRKFEVEREAALLAGQLNEGQNADIGRLRQQSVEALVALQARINELEEFRKKLAAAELLAAENRTAFDAATVEIGDLRKSNADLADLRSRLADLTSQLADEAARANSSAMKAVTLGDINLKLIAAVDVLKQQVVVSAPSTPAPSPTRDDVRSITPFYKRGRVWAIAGGVALIIFLVVCNMKPFSDVVDNSPAAPTPEVVAEQAKPAVPAPATVAPSIQPNTPKSSCPYTSLNACVDDMARRLGVAPSDSSIRRHGPYSCQRIGCQ